MKKLSIFVALLFTVSVSFSQDFCGNVKSVLEASTSGFDGIKGKYTGAEYDGQWAASQSVAGAKSCIIEENTGWYVATMLTNASEGAALAKFNELKTKLSGCNAGMQTWNYDNVTEHLKTAFFSEGKQEQNVNGGETNIDESKRGYANWDIAPQGKTIELECRRINGTGMYEVRIKIYKA